MKTAQQKALDFKLAAEMYTDGLAMKRAQLRRRDPQATAQVIEERLLEWIVHRSDAPDGDAEGVKTSWPRR